MSRGDRRDDVGLAQLEPLLAGQLGVARAHLVGQRALGAEHRPVARQVRPHPEVRPAAAGQGHEVTRLRGREDRPGRQDHHHGEQHRPRRARRGAQRPRARPAPRRDGDDQQRDEGNEREVGARQDDAPSSSPGDDRGQPRGRSSQRPHGRRQRRGEQQRAERLGEQIAGRRDQRRVEGDRGRGHQPGGRPGDQVGEQEGGGDRERPDERLRRDTRRARPRPRRPAAWAQLVGEGEHERRPGRPVHRVAHPRVAVVDRSPTARGRSSRRTARPWTGTRWGPRRRGSAGRRRRRSVRGGSR